MTLPNDDITRVREAHPIERVVGEVVNLKPKGREYVGLCPFHDDHKPSMNVVPSKGIFHCFVCGTGGNVFTFVQKYHHMEFGEALRFLAEKAHIKLTPFRPRGGAALETDEPRVGRQDLYLANAFAANFFVKLLSMPEHGGAAQAVIEKRGISPQAVEQFMLGASPDRWDGLVLAVKAAKMDLELFAAAGLIKGRENGDGYYDTFRNRLMFPIQDKTGRVVAFGARKIKEEDEPKYLNSPESPLFNKSATLYALPQARALAMKSRRIVVVEGYMDVIACHQAGITNVVATLGTALTREHARELRLIADEIVLLFDGDDAGQKAADRAFDVFFRESIDVSIATLKSVTTAKDPDELLKLEGGKATLERGLKQSTPLLMYRYARLRSKIAGAGPAAVERALREDLAKLAELGWNESHPTRRQLILQQLSTVTGLSAQAILAAMPRGRDAAKVVIKDEPAAQATGTLTNAEHLIGCVLNAGGLWVELKSDEKDALCDAEYGRQAVQQVVRVIRDLAEDGADPALTNVLSQLQDPAAAELAVSIARSVEQLTEGDSEKLKSHFAGTRQKLAARMAPVQQASDGLERLRMLQQNRKASGHDPARAPRPG